MLQTPRAACLLDYQAAAAAKLTGGPKGGTASMASTVHSASGCTEKEGKEAVRLDKSNFPQAASGPASHAEDKTETQFKHAMQARV